MVCKKQINDERSAVIYAIYDLNWNVVQLWDCTSNKGDTVASVGIFIFVSVQQKGNSSYQHLLPTEVMDTLSAVVGEVKES